MGYGGVRRLRVRWDQCGHDRAGEEGLAAGARLEAGRVRREGAGRPRLTDVDLTLLEDLERLVDPDTRGDPESPLRWSSKRWGSSGCVGARGSSDLRLEYGEAVAVVGVSVAREPQTREGKDHPDRDAQFQRINETTRAARARGRSVRRRSVWA